MLKLCPGAAASNPSASAQASGCGGSREKRCPADRLRPLDCTARSGARALVARTMSLFGRNACCTSKAQFGSVRSATRLAREFARATGPLIPGRATGPALLRASRADPGVRSSCERSLRAQARTLGDARRVALLSLLALGVPRVRGRCVTRSTALRAQARGPCGPPWGARALWPARCPSSEETPVALRNGDSAAPDSRRDSQESSRGPQARSSQGGPQGPRS
jgi:hypothetical protein